MAKSLSKYFLIIFILLTGQNLFALDTIKLATVNWEPFYSKELPENGFFSAISREAFKRAGYEMEVSFLPWKRALKMVEKGRYDGLLGLYYNKERSEFCIFSDVVAKNEEVFVQKAELELEKKGEKDWIIEYEDLKQLKKYTIGGLLAGAQIAELKKLEN